MAKISSNGLEKTITKNARLQSTLLVFKVLTLKENYDNALCTHDLQYDNFFIHPESIESVCLIQRLVLFSC